MIHPTSRLVSLPILLALLAEGIGAQQPLYSFSLIPSGLPGRAEILGDVNGDARPDILIRQGSITQIRSGLTGAVLRSLPAGTTYLGRDTASAGDVDNDGVADVVATDIVLASPPPRVVRVFSGATGAVLHSIAGPATGVHFGYAVAGVGDFNGDGIDDFAIGSPDDPTAGSNAGSVQVRSGLSGAVLATFYGPSANSYLGKSVAPAGDVNNDGVQDIIAGGGLYSFYFGSGIVRVYAGGTGVLLHSFTSSSGAFGYSVCGAGDLNGDGFDDVAIGQPGSGPASTYRGSVSVRSGATGAVLFEVFGADGDSLGASVAPVGDMNQDGKQDLITAAPNVSNNNWGVVGAYASVRSGLDGSELGRVTGPSIWGASGFGDVDGDGRPDFLETEWQSNQQPVTRVFSAVSILQNLYPGTGEDLVLLSGVSSAPDALSTKVAHPNDWIELHLDSPMGTFDTSPLLMVGQVLPTAGGVPTYPPLPSVHLDFFSASPLLILFYSGNTIFGQPGMPAGGISLFLGFVPPGLAGTSLIVQGAAITPAAANQLFAATDAHEIRMVP